MKEKNSNLPVATKLKSVGKHLSILGLASVLMFSATFGIASCAPKTNVDENNGIVNPMPSTPQTPENPNTPDTPELPDTPPVEEKFELDANSLEKILKNLQPTFDLAVRTLYGLSIPIEEIFDIYLTGRGTLINTIGVTYFMHSSSTYSVFTWLEVTLPVTEDLTFKQLSEAAPRYNYREAAVNPKKRFFFFTQGEEHNAEAVDMAKRQAFGDYETADFTAWEGLESKDQYINWMFYYNNGTMREVQYYVNKNLAEDLTDIIKQNFYGKEPSDDTYQVKLDKTATLPEGFINIKRTMESFEEEN